MNYQLLLAKSKAHFDKISAINDEQLSNQQKHLIFTNGAKWMAQRMAELDEKPHTIRPNIPYESYGFFKYGCCCLGFLLSSYFFSLKAVLLLPCSICIFYLIEVHFLFLFPILIDKIDRPIHKSIQMTYKIGILRTIMTVLPIGVYMLFGLLRPKNPLRNWYLGCLAILIWYFHEKDGL